MKAEWKDRRLLLLACLLIAGIPFGQETAPLYSYGQFSLIDKLTLGLTGTTALLIFKPNAMFISCWALVLCTLVVRRRGIAAYAIAVIPTIFILWACFAEATRTVSGTMAANAPFYFYRETGLVLAPKVSYMYFPDVLPMLFLLVLMLGLMAATVYLALGHSVTAAMALSALLGSFLLKMAMAFSPVLAQTGEITMLPVYAAVIYTALLCVRSCGEAGMQRRAMRLSMGFCTVMSVLNLLRLL